VRKLREWFGPSRAELWRLLSDRIGASYAEGGFAKSDRVEVSHRTWTITLDCYFDPASKVTYTRLTAPYVNPDGFRFSVSRRGIFTDLAMKLGMQDVVVDQADFDEQFVIKGTDEANLRRLFANSRLRDLLTAQPKVRFGVDSSDNWFRKSYPPTTDRLQFIVPGVIKDIDRLEQLFALLAETLDQLCDIGSAYDSSRSDQWL
jgi:hypothetical protein